MAYNVFKSNGQMSISEEINLLYKKELPKPMYDFNIINKFDKNRPFDIVILNDNSEKCKRSYGAYLIDGDPYYTDCQYTVLLNRGIYNGCGYGDQMFIYPYLSTLDERLLPDYAFYDDGKCRYDLSNIHDRIAMFINVVNLSNLGVDKKYPEGLMMRRMEELFLTYPGDRDIDDKIILADNTNSTL